MVEKRLISIRQVKVCESELRRGGIKLAVRAIRMSDLFEKNR